MDRHGPLRRIPARLPRLVLQRCFDRRSDALFELTDALLTAGSVPSPVHLSLAPAHRRGWGSLYAALRRGRIDEAPVLRELLARLSPAGEGDRLLSSVYAVDVSVWSRCDAEASPRRGDTTTTRLQALRRPAHRRRLGLPVRRGSFLPARLMGGACRLAEVPSRRGHQRGCRGADPGVA